MNLTRAATVNWKWFSIDVFSTSDSLVFDATTHYFDHAQMNDLARKAYTYDYEFAAINAVCNTAFTAMRCDEILRVTGEDQPRASILLSDIESLVNDKYDEKRIRRIQRI